MEVFIILIVFEYIIQIGIGFIALLADDIKTKKGFWSFFVPFLPLISCIKKKYKRLKSCIKKKYKRLK